MELVNLCQHGLVIWIICHMILIKLSFKLLDKWVFCKFGINIILVYFRLLKFKDMVGNAHALLCCEAAFSYDSYILLTVDLWMMAKHVLSDHYQSQSVIREIDVGDKRLVKWTLTLSSWLHHQNYHTNS